MALHAARRIKTVVEVHAVAYICCGSTCCSSDQNCCGGTCCSGACCDSSYCSVGQSCCGGVTCCSGSCNGTRCILGNEDKRPAATMNLRLGQVPEMNQEVDEVK